MFNARYLFLLCCIISGVKFGARVIDFVRNIYFYFYFYN